MSVVAVSYPGVYITEELSLALEVDQAPTAVPVFACSAADYVKLNKLQTSSTKSAGNKSFQQNSSSPAFALDNGESIGAWMDSERVDSQKPSDPPSKRINTWLEVTRTQLTTTDMLYRALKAYFDNGGGYCYVVDVEKLTAEVPKLREVTLLVAAGQEIKPETVIALCDPADSVVFGILDVSSSATNSTLSAETTNLALGSSQFTAAYYPWLNDVRNNAVPPSAAVAGVYCAVDRERGVWKAPANISLQGGLTPMVSVNDALQGTHTLTNPINMIRSIGDRTAVVWGARTRATADNDKQWRHIPVRRLFNSIEQNLRAALGPAVFEPNNEATWERVRTAIVNYLHRLWLQGALQGASEEEAYFVAVGKQTMTQEDINDGKLIVKVGVAAAYPAEFIILSLSQNVMRG